jgi:hypothetical protein
MQKFYYIALFTALFIITSKSFAQEKNGTPVREQITLNPTAV